MKRILLSIFYLSNFIIYAQDFKRNQNESATDFVSKNIPFEETRVIELFDKVVESGYWFKGKKVIFCFYENYNQNIKIPDTYIQAYVFIELSSNIYRRIFIDNFNVGDKEINGIKIESIFFSNIDNDSDKELGIIISQITGEGDTIDYEGRLFFTKFYDKPNYNQLPKSLNNNTSFDSIFYELEGKIDDGEFKKAKFKTASDVKNKLKQLGF